MSVATDLVGASANSVETRVSAAREHWQRGVDRAGPFLQLLGLGWVVPCLRVAAGESARTQGRELWRQLGIPVLAIAVLIGLWAWLAPRVHTSLGARSE